MNSALLETCIKYLINLATPIFIETSCLYIPTCIYHISTLFHRIIKFKKNFLTDKSDIKFNISGKIILIVPACIEIITKLEKIKNKQNQELDLYFTEQKYNKQYEKYKNNKKNENLAGKQKRKIK